MGQRLPLLLRSIWRRRGKFISSRLKAQRINFKIKKKFILILLFWFGILIIPIVSMGQEINIEGWPIPDLRGLTPYYVKIEYIDGVEKMVERFFTTDGGHVARVSGNGKVFAYAVDTDQEPPIDYLLLDPDGSGKFTQKFKSEDFYLIPEWVSH